MLYPENQLDDLYWEVVMVDYNVIHQGDKLKANCEMKDILDLQEEIETMN